MARRRRRGSKREGAHWLSKAIMPAALAISLLQQTTQKDVTSSGSTFNGLNPMQKGQYLLSDTFGRMTGIYLYPDLTGINSQGPTINPAGVINKWTGSGIALLIYSMVDKLPFRSQAKKLGAGLLAGGAIGGFFDQPQKNSGNWAVPLNSNTGPVTSGLSSEN